MSDLCHKVFITSIVSDDHSKLLLGPVRLASSAKNIHNNVMVFAADSDEYVDRRDIIAFQVQNWPSWSPWNKDSVEVEQKGRYCKTIRNLRTNKAIETHSSGKVQQRRRTKRELADDRHSLEPLPGNRCENQNTQEERRAPRRHSKVQESTDSQEPQP